MIVAGDFRVIIFKLLDNFGLEQSWIQHSTENTGTSSTVASVQGWRVYSADCVPFFAQ